ncbi:MAG: tetratricopeptide repeat protein [Rikenellaceae bacterium]
MATKHKKEIDNQDPEVVIETAINSTEEYIFKNGKKLITALVVLIVVVGGYFSYKYLIQEPKNKQAADMMFKAEQLFAADNFELALNGDENTAGFLTIVNQYGSTTSGNLAKHYAGVCYIKLGDLDNALTSLKAFEKTKGVPNQLLMAQNLGLQADIYSQKKEYSTAASLYEKAANSSNNNFSAPFYLSKLALVYIALEQNDKALAVAKRIEDEYPQSMEARDIQKLIGQLEQ